MRPFRRRNAGGMGAPSKGVVIPLKESWACATFLAGTGESRQSLCPTFLLATEGPTLCQAHNPAAPWVYRPSEPFGLWAHDAILPRVERGVKILRIAAP